MDILSMMNNEVDIATIKRNTLLNGIEKTTIDGEENYLLSFENVLKIGLETFTDINNGVSALKAFDLLNNFPGAVLSKEELECIKNYSASEILNEILLNNDIRSQLLSLFIYAERVAEKTKDTIQNTTYKTTQTELKYKTELDNKDKEIERLRNEVNNGTVKELQLQEQLRKEKNKYRKDTLKLEHKIAELEKQLNR